MFSLPFSLHSLLHRKRIKELNALTYRSLFGEPLNGTNRVPVVAACVVLAVFTRIEVEIPRAVETINRLRRPVGAARTRIDERSLFAIPGTGEEDAIRRILAPTTDNITTDTIH